MVTEVVVAPMNYSFISAFGILLNCLSELLVAYPLYRNHNWFLLLVVGYLDTHPYLVFSFYCNRTNDYCVIQIYQSYSVCFNYYRYKIKSKLIYLVIFGNNIKYDKKI
jgi:hypothetical protein